MKGPLIDDIDAEILTFMKEAPDTSQAEIATALGISQPTVSKRIRKLKDMGALNIVAGVDVKRLGLHLAKVDIATSDPNGILDMLGECPFFINGFNTTGSKNFTILLACDDYATLEAIVNHHIRPRSDVTDVDLSIVVSVAREFIAPIQLTYDREKAAPCGIDCGKCSCWEAGRCIGCPVTGHYRGHVWRTADPDAE